ncbi:MAG TPA: ChaB family protein [Anaerolineaceae bacterium]|nr:ChaB family protein [Anaerolineaceae bacterium]
MTVEPHKPNTEPGSEQANNLFENLPETLPPDARDLYFNAYQKFIDERGNNPELAQQVGMAAVLEHYQQEESSGNWQKKR